VHQEQHYSKRKEKERIVTTRESTLKHLTHKLQFAKTTKTEKHSQYNSGNHSVLQ